MNSVKRPLSKAKLVRDLSGIIFYSMKPKINITIDVSQSVLWDHPNAQHLA